MCCEMSSSEKMPWEEAAAAAAAAAAEEQEEAEEEERRRRGGGGALQSHERMGMSLEGGRDERASTSNTRMSNGQPKRLSESRSAS